MQSGKILQASKDGLFVIRLLGDVRLTLCTAFDDFIESMFQSAGLASIIIDLRDADGLDSTTLGLMAKIAVRAKRELSFTPIIVSNNPSITRLLESMCFQQIFDIQNSAPDTQSDFGELASTAPDESDLRDRILEAHKTLMNLSEHNSECFRDLVATLEQDQVQEQAANDSSSSVYSKQY